MRVLDVGMCSQSRGVSPLESGFYKVGPVEIKKSPAQAGEGILEVC